jgi:hypothetical protein
MGWAVFWAIFSQTHLVTLDENFQEKNLFRLLFLSEFTNKTFFRVANAFISQSKHKNNAY